MIEYYILTEDYSLDCDYIKVTPKAYYLWDYAKGWRKITPQLKEHVQIHGKKISKLQIKLAIGAI